MNSPRAPDDPHDEPARDAWLSEALRHAPDADAAPSVAVRETILRQARAATASATPARSRGSAWQRFNAAWSWLSGPRIAAGFASVMVATVVGLMWWDRPIDEALRRVEPPATVSAPAAPPAPAPTVPEPPATIAPPAPTPAPTPKSEAARDQAAAAPPRATAERKREARPSNDTASDHANDARREAPTALAAPRAADETRARADSARTEREAQELDAARERRSEAAQAKAAAPAAAPAPALEPAPAPAPAPALRSAPAAAAGATQAPAAAAIAPAPAPPPAVAAAAAPARQARTATLRALIEALGEESPRWRWQRDGAGERVWTPELQAWLQGLDRALAARRSNVGSAGQALAPDQGSTQELRLLRDGSVQAVVRFEPDGRIRIEMAGEAPLTAQLPAASTSALRRALDDATR